MLGTFSSTISSSSQYELGREAKLNCLYSAQEISTDHSPPPDFRRGNLRVSNNNCIDKFYWDKYIICQLFNLLLLVLLIYILETCPQPHTHTGIQGGLLRNPEKSPIHEPTKTRPALCQKDCFILLSSPHNPGLL